MAVPVVIVTSNGRPVTHVASLNGGAEAMTVVEAGGEPVVLAAAGGYPVTLLNPDNTLWEPE